MAFNLWLVSASRSQPVRKDMYSIFNGFEATEMRNVSFSSVNYFFGDSSDELSHRSPRAFDLLIVQSSFVASECYRKVLSRLADASDTVVHLHPPRTPRAHSLTRSPGIENGPIR